MRNFAELYRRIDETSKTSEKINLLVDYFKSSNSEDSIWGCLFFDQSLGHERVGELQSVPYLQRWRRRGEFRTCRGAV